MKFDAIRNIADVVLYEGYILYPYRASAVKNRQRFQFGVLLPPNFAEANPGSETANMRTECLVSGAVPVVEGRIRCLHLQARDVWRLTKEVTVSSPQNLPADAYESVPELRAGDRMWRAWEEGAEREAVVAPLRLEQLLGAPHRQEFTLAAGEEREWLRDAAGQAIGVLVHRHERVTGLIVVSAERLTADLWKLTVEVENTTPAALSAAREEALRRSLVSAHTALGVERGEFVSLLDPPEPFAAAAAGCRNVRTYPVLAGVDGRRDVMLSSPIILYDYPQVAAQSTARYCDSTEIDEMLVLRVMTLTDDEKQEMREIDAHARELLERTERYSVDDMLQLHGTLRDPFQFADVAGRVPPRVVERAGQVFTAGSRVRLRPRRAADIFDLELAGKTATIDSIEQDFEDNLYVSVVLDDDPGRDLGLERQPGHRFFFSLDEVESLDSAEALP